MAVENHTPETPLKKCSKCKREFPATMEWFHKSSRSKDGLCNLCKECRSAQKSGRFKFPDPSLEGYKFCKKCQRKFPSTPDYFYRHHEYKDGLVSTCKECYKSHSPILEEFKRCIQNEQCVHPEGPVLPATLEYFYLDHGKLRARCKACCKAYRNESTRIVAIASYYLNRDSILLNRRIRYVTDPEYRRKKQEYSREWKKRNPDRVKEQRQIRNVFNPPPTRQKDTPRLRDYRRKRWLRIRDERMAIHRTDDYRVYQVVLRLLRPDIYKRKNTLRAAREAVLPDTFSKEQYTFCMTYWDNQCAITGEAKDLHLDHWIPLASPNCPGTVATNMIPLSGTLNRSKKDKAPMTWLFETFPEEEARQTWDRIESYFDLVQQTFPE
jgi:hypothetical protein